MPHPPLTVTVSARPDLVEMTLAGIIDETADLSPAVAPPGAPVIIDAGAVENINSLGVRGWVHFIDALCAQSPTVILRRLSPVLVIQASMISNFLGTAAVESFFTPWFCNQCDNDYSELYAIDAVIPQAVTCPRCQSAMVLDGDRDSYLGFRQNYIAA
ncbi:MAG TPA: hypothetical protein VFG83_12765 [Kofleriaceae bacterium]|nr:hypothetical protein [Kofleriaceae bacterium]